ncbi:uncharacterized protein involved in oxidation of intracellular sulfur [Salirhabdus euzebyi]|uniref:Uncharacterized protein involved in oxidation of intracellular sulfur n=1 Tax=Salirhabdus euzebyi TaxID=394506 RepID=A0A841PWQ6_9BACI|nr:DsrE family protein [Salirhabdus euzebyi]MBB6451776.1 uncharacterized protein involved in oxidation of intracellular sulfur [Salirhabdus euzebyi]
MRIGIIIETKEAEKAWNAFRFANACVERGLYVKVFLMGEAVECDQVNHEQYNVPKEMEKFIEAKGILFACGTCIQSRKLENQTICPISTMNDCVDILEWADKMVTF